MAKSVLIVALLIAAPLAAVLGRQHPQHVDQGLNVVKAVVRLVVGGHEVADSPESQPDLPQSQPVHATAPDWPKIDVTPPPAPAAMPPTGSSIPLSASISAPVTRVSGDASRMQVTPARGTMVSNMSPIDPPADLAVDAALADRVQQCERSLRAAGAVSYELESWGADRPVYRFQCRMSVPNKPGLTRHFESTADDPAAAAETTLAQINRWLSQQP